MRKRAAAGFTLLELLVAIAIIAVLTLISMPAIQRFRNTSKVVGAARTIQTAFNRTRAAAVATNRTHRLFLFIQAGPGDLPMYGLRAFRDDGPTATPRYVPSDVAVLLQEGVFVDCDDSQIGVLVGPPRDDLGGIPATEGIFIRPDGQIVFGGGAVDVPAARDTNGFSLYDSTQGFRLMQGQVLADLVVYDRTSPSYGFLDVSPLTGKTQFAIMTYLASVSTSGTADFVSPTAAPIRPKFGNANRTLNHALTTTSDTDAANDGAALQF